MNRLLRTPITEQARKVRAVLRPFQEFLQAETSSGLLLVVCTVIAFAWANSPWAAGYEALLEVHLTIGIAGFLLDHPLHVWINDGLMTIFFLLVGLELKREFMVGELSAPRQALLPIIAAAGGALCPALIYSMLNFNTAGAKGWGIPMATDIAFALGILLLVGRQLPESLRVFLSALAIADDLIAVLVIALFYTQNVNFLALGIAAGSVCYLFLLNRMCVRYLAPSVLGGL
ncbi:MAG: Na+/H+ antiporter NhaA, partial [Ktedonobacteraceae bacterium]|nr:Na+/H+ antiporter NhaA [Ktedonobacteraceae bacterium]